MAKNLLLLHLESISQSAFWQYAPEMPMLYDLMRHSTYFSRFHSASTSSVMSMSDLLHGDSAELDHLELFPSGRGFLRGRATNLMGILADRGYNTLGLQLCSFALRDIAHNFWSVWPEACGQFVWRKEREEAYRDARALMTASSAPFALYFWNMNTHLQDEEALRNTLPYHERFLSAVRHFDLAVKQLLHDLAAAGKLENTVIVAFGDHGDDLWRHGLYRGRSHIVDPYATVAWCPLFIYEHGKDAVLCDRLTSMVDVKSLTLSRLFPDDAPESPASPFSGFDSTVKKRELAFSQCMFALQKERTDPAGSITKSYAVTDGDLRVMASAHCDSDDTGGMELYFDQYDSGNTWNVLHDCLIDDSGNITGIRAASSGACLPFPLSAAETPFLAERYAALREALVSFVRQKEEMALQHFIGETPHLFPEELFTRIRGKTNLHHKEGERR